MRIPITLKTRDLNNYRLLFFVYIPNDNDKVHSQITEAMVEQEPMRYTFYPFYFAKLPLLSREGVIGGSSKDQGLSLMKFSPKKYLAE